MYRFLIFLILFANSGDAQVNLNKGLVAYYPFNGNAKDESGKNNHPSIVRAKFVADRFGKPNAACAFNGKNNYIKIPDDRSLHFPNGFSISVWVLVNDFYEGTCHGNRIIMKGSRDYLQGNYSLNFDDNFGTNGTNCERKFPDKKKQSFYGPASSPVTYDFITTGKWYMLTYIYDGKNAMLYVDCKLAAKGTLKNYDYSNDEDLFFGKMDNQQYPYYFNGILDEVRFYNRPLSKAEVQVLCDTKPADAVPEVFCTGANIVSAKFNYLISDCSTVAFNLSSSITKNLKSIQWSFGDGTSSKSSAPVHTYKKMGKFNVTAIVTSNVNCIDTFSRTIQLQSLQTDFVYTEQNNPGEILFKGKNNKASYSWNFGDKEIQSNSTVVKHAYKESGKYKVQLFAQDHVGCKDTVEKLVAILIPAIEPGTEISNAKPIKFIIPDNIHLEKRTNDIVTGITTDNDSVTVSIYDNGIIDGDSISLIYNDVVILTHQVLKAVPVTLKLKIDPDRPANELSMFAENQGSIPPNTALMIIYDGEKRHEINVSSSNKINGTILFTSKKYNTTF